MSNFPKLFLFVKGNVSKFFSYTENKRGENVIRQLTLFVTFSPGLRLKDRECIVRGIFSGQIYRDVRLQLPSVMKEASQTRAGSRVDKIVFYFMSLSSFVRELRPFKVSICLRSATAWPNDHVTERGQLTGREWG